MVRLRGLTALTVALVTVSLAPAVQPAQAADVSKTSSNFSSCSVSGSQNVYPASPHTNAPAHKPTGSKVRVTVTQQPWDGQVGVYQQIPLRVGNQEMPAVFDTGSSWMVINQSVLAGNPKIVPTGEHAAIAYSGGSICASGPVMRGPVSIGGLKPRTMKFLLATGGNFPWAVMFGANTWKPPSTHLDIPLNALAINKFELTLTQRTFDPTARGQLVVNGTPTIRRANPNKVLTYRNRLLAGGDRIYVPGALTTSDRRKVAGNFMLDVGTPFNDVALFPSAARKLGFNFATNAWANPNAKLGLISYPSNGGAVRMAIDADTPLVGNTLVVFQPKRPSNGVVGLSEGTSAALGADFVRPYVLGVHFTKNGSVIQLLHRR